MKLPRYGPACVDTIYQITREALGVKPNELDLRIAVMDCAIGDEGKEDNTLQNEENWKELQVNIPNAAYINNP